MSYNPEFDRLIVTEPGRDSQEAQPLESAPAMAPPAPAELVTPYPAPPQYAVPEYAPAAPLAFAEVPAPARKKRGLGWVLPVVIALIGLIASGSLGYLLYTTTNQREAALQKGAATQASLDKLQSQFDALQADAASRKVVADYVYMVERNNAQVQVDYQSLIACKTYGACRVVAQNLYNDLQAWQSERTLAHPSAALVAPDHMLGDALTAAIAGARQFISGMDTFSNSTAMAGAKKIDAAMLSIAKAETAIGSVTQQNP